MMDFWTLVQLTSTFMVFSFFYYKDNPLFRIAQELVTALILAHVTVTAIQNIDKFAITPITSGNFLVIIPTLLGLMVFLQLYPKYKEYAQWPVALVIGAGLGIGLQGAISTDIAKQVRSTILPISGGDAINNIILILCVLLTMFYFTFSQKTRVGVLEPISQTGRYIVLGTMGAIFGVVAMSRFALLIGRITFILKSFGLL
jgi:hypothetical protein